MFNFGRWNQETLPFTNTDVQKLIKYRGMYNYPKAYIKSAKVHNHDIDFGNGNYGQFVQPLSGEITDLWLDNYHGKLLHSHNNWDNLLGIASIVYWGYYTFAHNYASNRVKWLLQGHGGHVGLTATVAHNILVNLIHDLTNNNSGSALSRLHGVGQLQQTPFASKIIAHASPNNTGVYDNRLRQGLNELPWAFQFNDGIGNVGRPAIQRSYQSWCSFITMIASQINLGISLGKQWHWTCGDDKNQKWRAIDVERALFAMFAATPRSKKRKKNNR